MRIVQIITNTGEVRYAIEKGRWIFKSYYALYGMDIRNWIRGPSNVISYASSSDIKKIVDLYNLLKKKDPTIVVVPLSKVDLAIHGAVDDV